MSNFLKMFRRRDTPDIASTPTAPKMRGIPLPDVEESEGGNVVLGPEVFQTDEDPDTPEEPENPLPSPAIKVPTPRRPSTSIPRCPSPRAAASRYDSPAPKWKSASPTSAIHDHGRRYSTPQPTPQPESLKTKHMRSSTPQPSTSRMTERSLSPQPEPAKVARKGILKSTVKPDPVQPFELHWQLHPYNRQYCKKRIYFNVAQSTECIRDHSSHPPLALSHSDLKKPAANVPLTKMTIQCPQLPHWDITVKKHGGILCYDVFNAIYDTLHEPLTHAERERYVSGRRARCEKAFEQRCKDTPGLTEYHRQQGMRRVDLLEGKTIFMGLKISPDVHDPNSWVMELGLPRPDGL